MGLLSLPAGMDATEAAGGLLGAREAGSPVIAIPARAVGLRGRGCSLGACKEVLADRGRPPPSRPWSAAPSSPRPPAAPGRSRSSFRPPCASAETAFDPADLVEHGRFESASALRARPDLEALHEAVERLAKAERPIVVVGPDVHVFARGEGAPGSGRGLAHPGRAIRPVGKGAIACASELFLFFGQDYVAAGGAAARASFLAEADLILAIGGALDEIAAAAPGPDSPRDAAPRARGAPRRRSGACGPSRCRSGETPRAGHRGAGLPPGAGGSRAARGP